MVTWLKLTLLPPIGAMLIRLLGTVLRLESRGTEHVDALYREGRRVILAFWHGRQLMIPIGYRGTGAHVLISQHQDGELIHRIISRFGHRSVRGSTTRGGVAALRQLIKLGRSGVDLAITPDGPKGPREVVQMGVIHLARATGLPILPLTFSCSKKNTSRAGTAFSCPTRWDAGCSFGGSRSGCSRMPVRRRSKRSGWNWSRR